jgi:hypothetical protein
MVLGLNNIVGHGCVLGLNNIVGAWMWVNLASNVCVQSLSSKPGSALVSVHPDQ